jgi:hypothetical protein
MYGQTLAASTLSGGAATNASGATVSGTFAYTTPTIAPNAGTTNVSATFTPDDTANYNNATTMAAVTVNVAALSITANNDSKTYGQTKTYGSGQTTFSSSGLQNGDIIGTVTFTASGGTTTNSPVGTYNLTPSAATGGNINTNNYAITYNAGTLTVNPLAVNLTGSRSYDGTTNAVSSILTVANALGGDTVSVVSGAGGLSSALVGSRAITWLGTLALGGARSTNYTLVGAGGSVSIGALPVALSGSRNYDGTATAAASVLSITNVQPGDTVSLGVGSATLASRNQGQQGITSNTLTLTGASAANYTTAGASGVVQINKTNLTVTAVANTKTYDGTTNAASVPTVTSGNVQAGDTATAWAEYYADPNIGTGKTLTPAGVVNDGNGGNNYNYSYVAVTSGVINGVTVTISSGLMGNDKVYDGTTVATLSSNNVVLSGVAPADASNVALSTNGYSASFGTASAGAGKSVTVTGLSLTGSAAGNYTLVQPTGLMASITARPVVLTGTRAYDGTVVVTATNLVISNNVDGGNLTLSGTAQLAAKDVGSQSVSASAILANITRVRTSMGSVGASAATSFNVTIPVPTNGNALVAVISTRGTSGNRVSSITQSGAVWTRASQGTNTAGSTVEIWCAPNVTNAGTTVTVNLASSLFASAAVMEYSGLVATNPADVSAGSFGNSINANTGSTPTTTQTNEVWVGGFSLANSTYTLSALLNSFISVTNVASTSGTTGNNAKLYAIERIATAKAAALSGGTVSSSSQWSGTIATFKGGVTSGLSLVLGGSAAGNYTLTGLSGSVVVTPAPVTVASGLSANSKVFDGTTAGTINSNNVTLAGVIAADVNSVTLSTNGYIATFDSAGIGAGRSVAVSSLTLTGSGAGNYSLTQPVMLSADITAAVVTIASGLSANDKVYDGTTGATIISNNVVLSGVLAGDAGNVGVATSGYTANFNTPYVGTGKAVVVTGLALTGSAATNYSLAQPTLSASITPAALSVTAGNQGKTYGAALALGRTNFTASGLLSGDSVSGVTLTSSGSGATALVGTYTIVPGAATGSGLTNYSIAYNNGTLTVGQANLSITARNQSKPYGAALVLGTTNFTASGLLNGDTVTGVALSSSGSDASAAVGSYGIVPSAATGSGLTNYSIAYNNGILTVGKATPMIAGAPTPSAIMYGQTLAASTLSGGAATNASGAAVSGSFAFTSPANVPNAGTTNVSVTFTPDDTANYNTATMTVAVTVSKQTPVVATAPTATGIAYGQTLAAATLSGGTVTNAAGATVSGSFAYATPGLVPNAGTTNVSVTFTPSDTVNYNTATATVTVTVNTQTPIISTAPTPSAITYGQTLVSSALSGGTATNAAGVVVSGSFAFTTSAIAPNAGSTNVSVTFTPTDTTNYNTATKTVTVTVNKAVPVVTAPVATVITYGQTLAASTMSGGAATNANNNASVAGNFAFTTPSLSPNAGSTNVSVTFAPTDTANYNNATTTVSVSVSKQTPVVATVPTPSAIAYGQTLAASTLSGGTATNAAGAAVSGGFAFSTPGIAPSAGSTNVSVTFTPTDTTNYNAATKTVTVAVNKATPSVATAPATSAITYGQTLAASTLNGGVMTNASGATVTGSFAFTTPTIAPNAGTTNVSATFTPSDTANYNNATTRVVVAVSTASLNITANNDSKTYGQSKTYGAGQVTFSSSGLQNGDTIGTVTISASGGTATNSPAGTYNLTPGSATGGTINTNNYAITYSAGTLTVSPLAVSLTGSRAYDGTTNAVFNILTVANTLGGDVVTVASGTAGLSSASVGSRAITSLGTLALGGARSTNYTLVGAGGSVSIGALPVALSGSRNYNGTTSAAASILTITNILAGDTVTLSGGSATLSSRNQGQQGITSNTLTLTGASAANYTTAGASGAVQINKTNLTVTAVANTKTYDGTTNAAGVPTITSGNVQTGDTATAWAEYYVDPNIGTGKTLTPAGVVNDGNGGNNYNYAYVAAASGVINGVTVTISSGLTANGKVYDGTTVATLSSNNVVLSGVAPADLNNVALSTNGYSASYGTASVGAGKSVTVAGLSLAGGAAGNYTLAQPVLTASITARPVVLTGTRVYDGTTVVTATNLVISNNVDGGNLTLSGTAQLVAKDVGSEPVSTAVSAANVARVKTSVGSVGSTAATSFAVNIPVPTNGNALVAVISTRGSAGNQVTGLTQSGAVWTRASQGTNTAGSTVEIWCAPNVTNAGTTVTVNLATSLYAAAAVVEYSGLVATNPADVSAGSSGNSINANTGSTPTTTQTNEVWVGGIGLDSSVDTLSGLLNSFVSVTNMASGNGSASKNALVYAIERIAAAKSSASSGGTVSSSAQWSGTMATFKAAMSSGTALVLSGSAAGNYTLTGLSGSVVVTPATVSVASGLAANSKTYDGMTSATINSNNVVLNGVLAADANSVKLSTNGYAAAFNSAGIGAAKSVSVSNLTLTGSGSGNYTLPQPVLLSANITAATVTIASGLSANSKTYDGAATATINSNNVVFNGIAVGDAGSVGLSTNGYAASFNTPYVGSGKPVTVSGLALVGSAATNYSLAQPALSANITPAALSITARNQGKTYGAAPVLGTTNFTVSGLLGGDTVSGVTLTSSGLGAAAPAGTYSIVPGAATGSGLTNYSIAYINGTLTVGQANLSITAGNQSKAYGATLVLGTTNFTASGLLNGDTVTGVALSSIGAAASATVGSYGIVPSAATGSGLTNYSIGYNNGNLTVSKATPMIASAPTSSAITYGQTLAASTLNNGAATNASGGTVSGGFAFTTPTLAPNAGSTNVSVTFTPGDTANYNTTTTTVTVTVGKQTPVVAAAPTPTAISYGQTLANSTLTGGTVTNASGATVTGSFAYTTPTIAPSVGITNVSVTFTPTDLANYSTTTTTVTVTVNKPTPIVATAPTPSAITYGQTLLSSLLSGGTATNATGATVAGSFAYTTTNIAPNAGTTNVNVTFTPADTANYNTATKSVTVPVNKATPVLTAPVATAITYGQTLASSTFSGGAATNANNGTSVAGSFAFATPGITPNVGSTNVGATFTPTDTANYNNATVTVNVTVNVASLIITANNGTKIYGQTKAYGAGMTNFTSSGLRNGETIGSVTIATSGGTAATDGTNTYTLTPSAATGGTFTAANYSITYNNGTLTVNPLAAILSGSRTYNGTTNALATILTVANIVSGDNVTVASGAGGLASENVGTQSITTLGTLTLGGTRATNYTMTGASGSVTISKTNLTVTATVNTKAYDGTTNAAASPTITSGSIQSGDSAPVWTESYNTPYVGTAKTLTPAGVVNDGNGGNNYNYTYATTATGVINPATVTVASGITANSKVYNGTMAATINSNNVVLSGVVNADTNTVRLSTNGYTASFATAGVGTNIAVTVSGLTLTGSVSTNYSFTQPAGLTANILAGAASKLAFITSAFTNAAGAVSGTVTVQRQDQYGNAVTAEAARTVTLTSSSSGTITFSPSSSLTIATNSSSASFTYTDTKVGTPTLTAASTSPSTLNSATQLETIVAGTFVKLQILVPGETAAPGTGTGKTGTPSTQTAATPFNVTVNAVDANWNPVNMASDTVQFTSTGSSCALPAGAPLSAGTGTFSVMFNVSGTGTLTVSDGSNGTIASNTSPNITISAPLVTPAFGGSAISANTQNGAFTKLNGPIYTEAAVGNISPGGGSAKTITLVAPAGFVFDPNANPPTVVQLTAGDGTASKNINDLSVGGLIPVTASSNALTITVTAASTTTPNTLTWSNVWVRPTAGKPLASGNLTVALTNVTMNGVVAGSTHFGTLTEVSGAASKLVFTTLPLTNFVGVAAGTITVQRQDQFGNPVANETSRTVTLSSSSTGTATFTPASPLTLATNASLASFTYTDTKSGTPTITASSTSPSTIISATQQETLMMPAISFTGLTASQSVTYGTTAITLSGKVSGSGPVYPAIGETITVTINGNPQTTAINDATGDFSIHYNSATIPYSASAYAISYIYGGNGSLAAITNSATTLTVNKANLSVTANNDSKTYGQARTYGAAQTGFLSSGLQNSETIGSVTITASGGTAASNPIGAYALTPSAATGGSFNTINYTITYNNGTLNVSPLVVSLTGSRPYDGTSNAVAGILSVANAVGSDNVTVASGTGGLAGKNVGSRSIASPGTLALGGTRATNYTLVGATGSVTISQAPLVITANDQRKTYGTALALGTTAFSVGTGLASGESIAAVTLTANGGTNATDAAGTYTITPSAATGAGGFTGSNYSITYNTGTLTVNQATTALTLLSSLNPSGFKDVVYFTATNLPPDATATVVFLAGGVPFSTNALSGGGTASLVVTNLVRGTNVITAQYAGDANYIGSTNVLDGGQIVTNHPPVAGNLVYACSTGSFGMAISVLLTNVTDVDGDTINLTGFTTSTNGVTITTNAMSFQYQNTNNVNDQFNYMVSDGFGGTASGTITVITQPFPTNEQANVTLTASKAQLTFYGIPNYTYGVQRSTNMVNWSTIWTTNTPSSGEFYYEDNFSDLGTKPASAFYRLIWNP